MGWVVTQVLSAQGPPGAPQEGHVLPGDTWVPRVVDAAGGVAPGQLLNS